MINQTQEYRVCSRGIWDTSLPGITFDKEGVSNYAELQDSLEEAYPRGKEGKKKWEELVSNIKKKGKSKTYNCIIGVSGGTDSSYLLHIANHYGLRPLAVNLDNGWSSSVSVKNIKKVTSALKIDLETYVIDYEEVKDVLRAHMYASLPWIDSPTDLAIKAVLYKIASREKIKYILNGADFRSEGKQPLEWTYSDAKQFKFIHTKYGKLQLKTYPYMSLFKQIYYGFFLKIKMHRPFYYLDYNKSEAQKLLINKYDWEYYGGHHHENIFTKFAISYWLPQKFKIDKRIITLSAQILSSAIKREDALKAIIKSPYDEEKMEIDKDYLIKKLDITSEEFIKIFSTPNKFYFDYPSYLPWIKKTLFSFGWIVKLVIPDKPLFIHVLENKSNK